MRGTLNATRRNEKKETRNGRKKKRTKKQNNKEYIVPSVFWLPLRPVRRAKDSGLAPHLYPVGVGKTVKSAHRQGLGPAHGSTNLILHWLRQRPEKTKRGARTTARKCTLRAFRGQRASAPARTAPCGAGCPWCLYKKTSPAASLFHLQGYSSTVVPFPP